MRGVVVLWVERSLTLDIYTYKRTNVCWGNWSSLFQMEVLISPSITAEAVHMLNEHSIVNMCGKPNARMRRNHDHVSLSCNGFQDLVVACSIDSTIYAEGLCPALGRNEGMC